MYNIYKQKLNLAPSVTNFDPAETFAGLQLEPVDGFEDLVPHGLDFDDVLFEEQLVASSQRLIDTANHNGLQPTRHVLASTVHLCQPTFVT